MSECNFLERSIGMLDEKLGKVLRTDSDVWSPNSTVTIRKATRYQVSWGNEHRGNKCMGEPKQNRISRTFVVSL